MIRYVVYLVLDLYLANVMLLLVKAEEGDCTNVICYYHHKAYYRAGQAKVKPEDIIPSVCTIIHFNRAMVYGGQIRSTRWEDPDYSGVKGLYARLNGLKAFKPALKVMLTVGDWLTPIEEFQNIAKSDNSMRVFADSVVTFLRKYEFDGLDLSWYFHDQDSSEQLSLLLEILKQAFVAEASRVRRNRLILSVSVGAVPDTTRSIVRKERLIRHVDYIVLMTTNYHGPGESQTGLNSPLYPKFPGDEACVKWTVEQWLRPGIDRRKLFFAMSPRGSSFTLSDPEKNGIGAPASLGKPGLYTKIPGFLAYYEICEMISEQRTGEASTDKQGGAISKFNDKLWVGYDNKETIIQKVEYAKEKVIGGVAMDYIDWDDAQGDFCKDGAFPLTRIANACSSMSFSRKHKRSYHS